MNRSDFNYPLPPELIAQEPLPERSSSRLLVLDGASGRLGDRRFTDLTELLAPGDLLVLNDTRVLPARLFGSKPTGGQVEVLLERIVDARHARAQVRASHGPRIGSDIVFADGTRARVVGGGDLLFELEFDCDVELYLQTNGQVPLPPYIERWPDANDQQRYQTVFARVPGAIAAPTAGLHFDGALLAALEQRGVEHAFLTLHVGAGTFAPVRSERIEEHELHAEWLQVPESLCASIERCRARGGRVVAVGTTSVRALETAALDGELRPFEGETRLFIYPGFAFRVVDAMVTNFHLPESSLLMLVAAFAGQEETLAAYRHAVEQRYRFFSYGDAMFVTPVPRALSRSHAI
ncbi:MAG TPA: tRNA preQ1(34) S-adenosylmethionine ribosyltransferase-isomerase QueA [Gammaproteobacteria bacterium]|nr:tRNA preQ1(34) S-adenosylmethionine ribosyltransferase-isomerase QueA [Gammaproteobacteria bacterium]